MDKQLVVDAINYLIKSESYPRLSKLIYEIIDNWEHQPMVFADKLTVLNALVDVGLDNRSALDRLMSLAAERRKNVPKLKRADYQRDLMRERRVRIQKALTLEESRLRKTLTATERAKHQAKLLELWNAEKAKFLAERGDLSWKERNAATDEFWQMIDAKLDANIMAEQIPETALKRKRGRPKKSANSV